MPKTAQTGKVDLYKLHKSEYVTPKEPVLIEAGAAKYLTVDGVGTPGGERFQQAVGALYQAAYTMKMAKKFAARTTKSATSKACGGASRRWSRRMPGAGSCSFGCRSSSRPAI